MLTEWMPGSQLPTAIVPTATYGEIHLGSSKVPICLHNLSTCTMDIPTKAVVGQVAPATQVPLVVPLTRDFQRIQCQTPEGMGIRGPGPPRPPRMAQTGAEAGQKVAAEMGAPVCMQLPEPGQNCCDQTQNRGNILDALQRLLLMYTSPHV